MTRKRTPTRQEKRTPKTIHEIADDHEIYFGCFGWLEYMHWLPFDSRDDSFHTPLDCSSCYSWCPSCIWSWVHDDQPRKPCDNGFAGYAWGQYRVQSCDNRVHEHFEAWVNTVL